MIEIRPVSDDAGFASVDRLYREVFAVPTEGTGLNSRLLTAITSHGGHVLGAFDGEGLAGFGFSFLGRDRDPERVYHYSQTVAVRSDRQNAGLGRRLKYAQRDTSLSDGLSLLRWSYDPMQARNAHLNLDVLGGRVRTFRPHYYGAAAPGRDTGERTDRFEVDWELLDTPARAEWQPPAIDIGSRKDLGRGVVVGLPADWHAFRAQVGRPVSDPVRAEVTEQLVAALSAGLVAISCRRIDESRAAYLFAPEEDA